MKPEGKKTILAIGILLCFAMISNVRQAQEMYNVIRLSFGSPDSVTVYEKRFAELKDGLELGEVVGYITDVGTESVLKNSSATARYYLAQYALSPSVVANSTEYEKVVGNFHQPITNSGVFQKRKFVVLKNLNNGVMLFRFEGK